MTSALSRTSVVAVVGAGAMGRGIALVAAHAGHPVILFDGFEGVALKAHADLSASYQALVAKDKIAENVANDVLANIRPSNDIADLAPALLVIEAIVENLEIKKNLFADIENLVDSAAILSSNTSSLSITELAKGMQRPERFAGFHFFNPANRMPLVEVVQGSETATEVITSLVDTATAWGKAPVVCRSLPGFIVNRVARPFYGEAMRLLEEAVCDSETLDSLLRDCGGFRMGPLELTDLIGHDVNFAVTQSVYQSFFNDPRYRPSLVQQELVRAGNLGRKTGRGFYRYDKDAAARTATIVSPKMAPNSVKVLGDLGIAGALLNLVDKSQIALIREEGDGMLSLDGLSIVLTDGRLAAERGVELGPVAVIDLCLDFEKSSRIGISFSDDVGQAAKDAACGLFQALGKQVSILDDDAGLVVMATIAMLINEAVDANHVGLASQEDIDKAMRLGANYPAGPFSWLAQLGAVRVLAVLENMNRVYPIGRYRASPLLRRMAANAQANSA